MGDSNELSKDDDPIFMKKNDSQAKKVWDDKYQQLVDFKNRFGHTRVSVEGQEYHGLGDWLSQQRSLYHKHKNGEEGDEFSLEKVALLEAIDSELDSSKQKRDESFIRNNDALGSESMLMHRMPSYDSELMDIADAYVIRAVLHSPERRRKHNELMHSSHRALFKGNFNENGQYSTELDDKETAFALATDIDNSNGDVMEQI